MPPRCSNLPPTLVPFLYPFLFPAAPKFAQKSSRLVFNSIQCRKQSHAVDAAAEAQSTLPTYQEGSHLNPPPADYSRTVFADKATITLHAGAGGHGCISFLREKYIAAGPANGGDGGNGGNVYIQAIRGETSLHKLARRGIVKAGRGKNGQGKTKGGERGEDVVILVPVGTVVREIDRIDLAAIEEERLKLEAGKLDGVDETGPYKWDQGRRKVENEAKM